MYTHRFHSRCSRTVYWRNDEPGNWSADTARTRRIFTILIAREMCPCVTYACACADDRCVAGTRGGVAGEKSGRSDGRTSDGRVPSPPTHRQESKTTATVCWPAYGFATYLRDRVCARAPPHELLTRVRHKHKPTHACTRVRVYTRRAHVRTHTG